MAKQENRHPYQDGTEHGYISFGEVNTYANEIEACKLQSGPDGGRHYITMQETGDKEMGSKGSTSITTPLPPDKSEKGSLPSSGTGDYPVVLEIEDINILDPGFGYDPNDKVVVGNGAELKIEVDSLGSLTKVDVLNGGIGFTEDPDIYIDSDSGYNAKLMPVFKVNRVGEEIAPEEVSAGAVLSVIDCVGKF